MCDRCRRPADDVIVIWSPQGHRFYCDPPNGFWYQIRKADPAAHKAAENAARAYATAWDNKR